MKQLICILIFLLMIMTYSLNVSAQTWTDDMSDMNSNSVTSYSNLVPVSQGGYGRAALNFIWGQNALTLSDTGSPGVAEYRIQGAGSVTVGIYTPMGTFVALSPYDNSHAFGIFQSNMNHLRSQQVSQTLYSPATGRLYARIGGEVRRLIYLDNLAVFETTADSPPSDLRSYGVNVYINGNSTPLSVAQSCLSSRPDVMTYDATIPICYELLTFYLPDNARTVRIEINDFRTVDLMENGTVRQRSWPANGQHTALGMVTFEGNSLQVGSQEPIIYPSESDFKSEDSSEASSAGSSSSSSRRSSASSTGSGAAAGGTGSSAAQVSKFEGQITSVISASSSTKQPAQSSSAPSVSLTSTAPSAEVSSGNYPGPEFFRMEPVRSSDGVSSGILLYVILVAGVILFLILRGKQEK